LDVQQQERRHLQLHLLRRILAAHRQVKKDHITYSGANPPGVVVSKSVL
jgi:hypothetical protein